MHDIMAKDTINLLVYSCVGLSCNSAAIDGYFYWGVCAILRVICPFAHTRPQSGQAVGFNPRDGRSDQQSFG